MNKKVTLLIVLLIFIFGSSSIVWGNSEVDPDIPDSWYKAPQTALENNINSFSQSPMLKEKIEEGELPSVEDRLPDNPPVIEPYKETGKYGGTLTTWTNHEWNAELDPYAATDLLGWSGPGLAVRFTPDAKNAIPKLVKGWNYSDNYKKFELYLYKGMKWSDGEPFNADDIMFWWNHVANNEELSPVSPDNWETPILNVEKLDNYSVVFHLGESFPYFHALLDTFVGNAGLQTPKHYLSQFHPEFVSEEKLQEEAKEAGFDEWYEYYEYNNKIFYPSRSQKPTLRPFVVVEREENYTLLERNPYYPFIDTEGNQLPYIDEAIVRAASSQEMNVTKIATGNADFAIRNINPPDIPILKEYESSEDYDVNLNFKRLRNYWHVTFNFTHEELREVFRDLRFRKAVSYALNQDEINDRVYFGEGLVRQTAPVPGSKFIEDPELPKKYTEYNPEKAKELLDDMGLKDQNGDGFRQYPDGRRLTIQVDYWDGGQTPVVELAQDHLKDVGIDIQLKWMAWGLYYERNLANKTEMIFGNCAMFDLGFILDPGWFAPTTGSWARVPWPEWRDWYLSDGESGEEPPDDMKELHDLSLILKHSTEEKERIKAGKELVETSIENLWTVGTVSVFPTPLVINENLQNVAKSGYTALRYSANLGPYYMIQTYFDE